MEDGMGSMCGPKCNLDISDRISECEFDLETAFLELVDQAVGAGWTRTEATIAITGLADNFMLGLAENEHMGVEIAHALENMKRPGYRGPRDF
ncbi:hypothetical protein GCM10007874_17640 [Labrys miyagiensis]|uniref:Uncharacterized protein n=2 Tax=Labrys miyagiensis TaxID=346912 RepID=A0ABQ6CKF5_9HYPH|nr:hypothetical protein GCM10007874_17640 [Labrys miyagiensis]